MPLKDTNGDTQAYPYISAVSLNTATQITVGASDNFSNIDDAFQLAITPEGSAATYMVELYLGCTWVKNSGSHLYFQLYVTGGGSAGIAGAAECRHASDLERPVLVRGIFQVTQQQTYTIQPQWRTSGGTGYIVTPGTQGQNLVSNFLTAWEISGSAGLVAGAGANDMGNVTA